MEEAFHEPEKHQRISYLDLIASFDTSKDTDNNQIAKFRGILGPSASALFDRVENVRKLVIVFLCTMDEPQLADVKKTMGEHVLGIHSLANDLQLLQTIKDLNSMDHQ